jgi:hypothetical protein
MHDAICSLTSEKAPGGAFCKCCWPVIKNDIAIRLYRYMKDLISSSILPSLKRGVIQDIFLRCNKASQHTTGPRHHLW